MTPRDITLADIFAAQRTLRPLLAPSPLRESEWLSARTGATVLLKLESLQLTHAFKIRGAFNALARLERRAQTTVVTASAGNHGRAVALAGQRLGIRTIVFAPSSAPATKKSAIVRHGAELHETADYDAAENAAREYASRTGAVFISPYNHPDVIAGAGTIALELLDQAVRFDTVVVPIGGGGLASGVAIALRHAAPGVRIVGVEVEASRPFSTSIARGAITTIDVQPSLADGLVGNLDPDSVTFDYVRRYVDRLVSVSEEDLRAAVRGLADGDHLIVEGAGAAATAALLGGTTISEGQRVAVLVTGANIDLGRFTEVLASDR
jgi:threonine dehydratase